MNIVLLGGPGAGKGTQAELLKEKFKMLHLSTGDILREAMKNNTEEGKKAKKFIECGELVPDQLIIDIMKNKLNNEDISNGLILDGFPRTVEQAEALETMLSDIGTGLDLAILIDTPDDVVIKRICSRRTCKNCGKIGSVINLRTQEEIDSYKCPDCGGEMYQRLDDNEETVLNRINVYNKNTQPLIDYYDKKGILKKVEGDIPDRQEDNAQAVFENLSMFIH